MLVIASQVYHAALCADTKGGRERCPQQRNLQRKTTLTPAEAALIQAVRAVAGDRPLR